MTFSAPKARRVRKRSNCSPCFRNCPQTAPLGKLLTDSKLPEEVLDVLIVDVLNRPNSLKLPLLLEVARDTQHPKAAEAKDLLELYLEEDYGSDWNKWQAKMEQWLKENPD